MPNEFKLIFLINRQKVSIIIFQVLRFVTLIVFPSLYSKEATKFFCFGLKNKQLISLADFFLFTVFHASEINMQSIRQTNRSSGYDIAKNFHRREMFRAKDSRNNRSS